MTLEEKKRNVLEVFNITAEKYVEYFGDDWEFIDKIQDFISTVNPKGKVLDLGCGSGYITKYMADNNLQPTGIDFSEKMIEIAKNRYPNLPFFQMDIANIEQIFDEDSFDGLLAIYTLYFIPKEQIDSVLESLSKILKDGASFFMVTQSGKGEQFVDESLMPDGKGEKALFVNLSTEEELRELFERHNFNVESFELIPNIDPDEISGGGRLAISVTNQKIKKSFLGRK